MVVIAAGIVLTFFDLTELKAWQVVVAFALVLLLVAVLAFKAHVRERGEHAPQVSEERRVLWVPRDASGRQGLDTFDTVLLLIMLALSLYKLVLD